MRFASIEINPISGDMAGNPLVWEGSSVASFPVPLFFKLEPADSGGYTGDTGDFKNFRIYGQPSHSYLKLYYRISDTFVAPGSMLYSGSYSLVPSTDPGASSPNIPLPGSAEYINLSSSSPQTQYFYLIVLMDAEPTETGLRSFTINFAWQQTV
jgi:hypothetical protein